MNINNICEGNRIFFVRKDVVKKLAQDENGKIVCPHNSVIFINKDTVNRVNLDILADIDQGNVENTIFLKKALDVQSVSESCINAQKKNSLSSQQINHSETNLSNKKITKVGNPEVEDTENKKISSVTGTNNEGFCWVNISIILSVLGVIIGIALAFFGGVVWNSGCFGVGGSSDSS